MSSILSLPTEVLDRILLFCDIWQLATLRQVCTYWRYLIDSPFRWRRVSLVDHHHGSNTSMPPIGSTIVNTWDLNAFQYLMNPHLSHIQSLRISGVRDSTVRLILNKCPLLEELEVVSFNTLSDHALELNSHFKLRRLIISGCNNPFFSIDALSLSHFLAHCPSLIQFSIEHCRLCIHPDIFLAQLERLLVSSTFDCLGFLDALQSLTLSILQRPWFPRHVDRLVNSCPNLKRVHLLSVTTSTTFDQSHEASTMT